MRVERLIVLGASVLGACGGGTFSATDAGDASTATDAGAGDASTPPFCAAYRGDPKTFCADFDEGGDGGDNWGFGSRKTRGTYALGLITDAWVSGPASLQATGILGEPTDGGGTNYPLAVLVQDADRATQETTVDLDARVEAIGKSANSSFVAVVVGPRVVFAYAVTDGTFGVAYGGGGQGDRLPSTPLGYTLKTWVHVHLVVTAGSPGHATMTVTKPGDQPFVVVDNAPLSTKNFSDGTISATERPQIQVGAWYPDTTNGPSTFSIDNVVMRVR